MMANRKRKLVSRGLACLTGVKVRELIRPRDTEPDIEVAVVRADEEAKVIANESRTIDPSAPAQHAQAAIPARPVATIGGCTCVLFVQAIIGPFPGIA